MWHLFTYGTLMFQEIFFRVTQCSCVTGPAQLRGHSVRRTRGQWYPVLLPSVPSETASGLVYFDLQEALFARLDAYESDIYERKEVVVKLTGSRERVDHSGPRIVCQAYLLHAPYADVALEEIWQPDWFEQHGLAEYLHSLGSFRP